MNTNTQLWYYVSQYFLEWEMFQTNVVEKIKTHLMFNKFFFPKYRAVYEINWKNIVQSDRRQITIWRMRIACWITKATNTNTDYEVYKHTHTYYEVYKHTLRLWSLQTRTHTMKSTNTHSDYEVYKHTHILWSLQTHTHILWSLQTHTHTMKSTNTHSDYVILVFSTVTMVARKRRNIAFYVHCLSCVSISLYISLLFINTSSFVSLTLTYKSCSVSVP